jgi:hypothetical protein
MDFIVGFPLTTKRHESIFMVVDTLMNSAHFIPVRTTYQVPDISRVFISVYVTFLDQFPKGLGDKTQL